MQSAYLKAFAAIGSFEGRSSLSTWLTRIVINEALGRQRSAKRRRAQLDGSSVTVLDDYREKLMRGSMSGTSPETELARVQIRRLLEQAIAALPEDFRLVFVLREIEGMTVEVDGRGARPQPRHGQDAAPARAAPAPGCARARAEGDALRRLRLCRRRLRGTDRARRSGMVQGNAIDALSRFIVRRTS